jgi:murein DD-endopeptidase MepM/ murein hydrolase activator NlpD
MSVASRAPGRGSRSGLLKSLACIAVLGAATSLLPTGASPALALEPAIVDTPDFPYVYPMSANKPANWGPITSIQSDPNNYHEGYDFVGWGTLTSTSGTPVFASYSGLATYSPTKGGGNSIRIDHGISSSGAGYSSQYTRYHHLAKYMIPDATWVAAGDLIGFEGSTGTRSGGVEHLHWEFRRVTDGKPLAFPNQIPVPPAYNVTALSPISFSGLWYLNRAADGTADNLIRYGQRGDIPVVGDWNQGGIDDIGIVRFDPNSTVGGPAGDLWWHLSTTTLYNLPWNTAVGTGITPFAFGESGDRPMPGDYDSDNDDAPALVRIANNLWTAPLNGSLTWHISNNQSAGAVHYSMPWGSWPGRAPVKGDWNADGRDSPGIYWHEGSSWWLTNTVSSAGGSLSYTPWAWGQPVDVPLAGDWNVNDQDRPIVFQKYPNAADTAPTWYRSTTIGACGCLNGFSFGSAEQWPVVLNYDPDSVDEYGVLS